MTGRLCHGLERGRSWTRTWRLRTRTLNMIVRANNYVTKRSSAGGESQGLPQTHALGGVLPHPKVEPGHRNKRGCADGRAHTYCGAFVLSVSCAPAVFGRRRRFDRNVQCGVESRGARPPRQICTTYAPGICTACCHPDLHTRLPLGVILYRLALTMLLIRTLESTLLSPTHPR